MKWLCGCSSRMLVFFAFLPILISFTAFAVAGLPPGVINESPLTLDLSAAAEKGEDLLVRVNVANSTSLLFKTLKSECDISKRTRSDFSVNNAGCWFSFKWKNDGGHARAYMSVNNSEDSFQLASPKKFLLFDFSSQSGLYNEDNTKRKDGTVVWKSLTKGYCPFDFEKNGVVEFTIKSSSEAKDCELRLEFSANYTLYEEPVTTTPAFNGTEAAATSESSTSTKTIFIVVGLALVILLALGAAGYCFCARKTATAPAANQTLSTKDGSTKKLSIDSKGQSPASKSMTNSCGVPPSVPMMTSETPAVGGASSAVPSSDPAVAAAAAAATKAATDAQMPVVAMPTRVLKPREMPMTEKQKPIRCGMLKHKDEHPTLDDVVSSWSRT